MKFKVQIGKENSAATRLDVIPAGAQMLVLQQVANECVYTL